MLTAARNKSRDSTTVRASKWCSSATLGEAESLRLDRILDVAFERGRGRVGVVLVPAALVPLTVDDE
jgi:hypothetical protein